MLPCRFVYIINTVTHLKFTLACSSYSLTQNVNKLAEILSMLVLNCINLYYNVNAESKIENWRKLGKN